MNINRRRFLATSGVSVAAGVLSARTSLSLKSASETPSGLLE
jgi:hypothetical protein